MVCMLVQESLLNIHTSIFGTVTVLLAARSVIPPGKGSKSCSVSRKARFGGISDSVMFCRFVLLKFYLFIYLSYS